MGAMLQSIRLTLPVLLLGLLGACAAGRSSERSVFNLDGASADLPFSHVVESGGTVWIAGTLGLDPSTGLPPADPALEARYLLDEIRAKLGLVGLTMDDLVSVQVFCSQIDQYGTFNAVYETYFGESFPVRAFVGSGPLLKGCRFEVNGIAVR